MSDLRHLFELESDPLAWAPAVDRSHLQVTEYRGALKAHVERMGPRLSSAPPRSFALYSDLVARHQASSHPAVLWVRQDVRRELSFAELHRRVSFRAAAWNAQGVEVGARLLLVRAFGLDWIVSSLAALHLGATLGIAEPGGPLHLACHVTAFAPDYVDCPELVARDLPSSVRVIEPESGLSRPTREPYRFGPKEICAELLSTDSEPPTAYEVNAEELYWSTLGDACSALFLRTGDAFAAPDADLVRERLSQLLSCLSVGATCCLFDETAWMRNPKLLLETQLRTIQLSPRVRDRLLAAPPQRTAWSAWFKNPEEPFDWIAWKRFVDRFHLQKIPHYNVLFDASRGGAQLCSGRGPLIDAAVYPMAGKPAALLETNGSGERALEDVGLSSRVTIEKDGSSKPFPHPPYVLLARRSHDFLYAGTLTPLRTGRAMGAARIVEAVSTLPFVTGACVLPLLSGGVPSRWLFLLLVFTGDHTARDGEDWAGAVQAVLRKQLNEATLPDSTRFVRLFPRSQKGSVDVAWCQQQHVQGRLSRKQNNPVFRALTALRAHCVDRAALGSS